MLSTIFVDTLSLVLLRLIVILSMFYPLSFCYSIFHEPKTLQRYNKFLFRENFVKKLTGFNLPRPLLPPLRLVLKSECKGRDFLSLYQTFLHLFFTIFQRFFTITPINQYFNHQFFYVVKHVFNKYHFLHIKKNGNIASRNLLSAYAISY